MVDKEAIEFTGKLKQWERSSDSGNRNLAYFCPDCGNRIYHINPEVPNIIKLKGRLDNSDCIQPSAHIWLSEKQAWFDVPDGVDHLDTQT